MSKSSGKLDYEVWQAVLRWLGGEGDSEVGGVEKQALTTMSRVTRKA